MLRGTENASDEVSYYQELRRPMSHALDEKRRGHQAKTIKSCDLIASCPTALPRSHPQHLALDQAQEPGQRGKGR
jgi:hypothetical protein